MTPARAFPPRRCPTSSSASGASRARARRARGWASPSAGGSWRPRGAPWTCAASRERAAPSASPCPGCPRPPPGGEPARGACDGPPPGHPAAPQGVPRMKSRSSLSLLLVLLLASWSASARAAEVVVWHGYRAAERTALEKVVAAYNAAQGESGTRVKLLAIPSDAFTDKISATLSRGVGPDVFV